MIWDKLKKLEELVNVVLLGQKQSLVSFSGNIYGQPRVSSATRP
jgi:hypothetical protein